LIQVGAGYLSRDFLYTTHEILMMQRDEKFHAEATSKTPRERAEAFIKRIVGLGLGRISDLGDRYDQTAREAVAEQMERDFSSIYDAGSAEGQTMGVAPAIEYYKEVLRLVLEEIPEAIDEREEEGLTIRKYREDRLKKWFADAVISAIFKDAAAAAISDGHDLLEAVQPENRLPLPFWNAFLKSTYFHEDWGLSGGTVFTEAVKDCNVDVGVVKALYEAGLLSRLVGDSYEIELQRSLCYAAENVSRETVDYLLSQGADPYAKSDVHDLGASAPLVHAVEGYSECHRDPKKAGEALKIIKRFLPRPEPLGETAQREALNEALHRAMVRSCDDDSVKKMLILAGARYESRKKRTMYQSLKQTGSALHEDYDFHRQRIAIIYPKLIDIWEKNATRLNEHDVAVPRPRSEQVVAVLRDYLRSFKASDVRGIFKGVIRQIERQGAPSEPQSVALMEMDTSKRGTQEGNRAIARLLKSAVDELNAIENAISPQPRLKCVYEFYLEFLLAQLSLTPELAVAQAREVAAQAAVVEAFRVAYAQKHSSGMGGRGSLKGDKISFESILGGLASKVSPNGVFYRGHARWAVAETLLSMGREAFQPSTFETGGRRWPETPEEVRAKIREALREKGYDLLAEEEAAEEAEAEAEAGAGAGAGAGAAARMFSIDAGGEAAGGGPSSSSSPSSPSSGRSF
jgi:hypothetical protein